VYTKVSRTNIYLKAYHIESRYCMAKCAVKQLHFPDTNGYVHIRDQRVGGGTDILVHVKVNLNFTWIIQIYTDICFGS
jgi:hypothetical protein